MKVVFNEHRAKKDAAKYTFSVFAEKQPIGTLFSPRDEPNHTYLKVMDKVAFYLPTNSPIYIDPTVNSAVLFEWVTYPKAEVVLNEDC